MTTNVFNVEAASRVLAADIVGYGDAKPKTTSSVEAKELKSDERNDADGQSSDETSGKLIKLSRIGREQDFMLNSGSASIRLKNLQNGVDGGRVIDVKNTIARGLGELLSERETSEVEYHQSDKVREPNVRFYTQPVREPNPEADSAPKSTGTQKA